LLHELRLEEIPDHQDHNHQAYQALFSAFEELPDAWAHLAAVLVSPGEGRRPRHENTQDYV
jgi:hypothetical protein